MRQILIIHGGTTYESTQDYHDALRTSTVEYERLLYSPNWKTWLAEQLPDHDVLLPKMPNSNNASYEEWALYFDKITPFLSRDAIIIGHSLGGIFLAKYLVQHPNLHFRKIILIAAPYSDETSESLSDFKLESPAHLQQCASELHVFHSLDDPVVPYAEAAKYLQDNPQAQLHRFSDKRHFNDERFDELKYLIGQ